MIVLRCLSRLLFNCWTLTVEGTPTFNVLPGVNNMFELPDGKFKEDDDNELNEFWPKIS